MSEQLPRVWGAHLDHVGVYIVWAHDGSYCRGVYAGHHKRIDINPTWCITEEERVHVEQRILDEFRSEF